MSDITALIERLVAAGADPTVAACVVAEAFVCGKEAAPYRDDLPPDTRSKAALRQKRYRERNGNVTKRNGNVTGVTRDDNVTKRNETITERNENVTPLRPTNSDISYLLTSSENLAEKKESKKERAPRKRNAPLRDDWQPSLRALQIAEENGVNAQIVEQIFRDYLKSSGKLYADYDAAFNNFLRNQRSFNGKSTHAKRPSAIIQAADDLCRKLASFDGPPGGADELRSDASENPPRLLSNG